MMFSSLRARLWLTYALLVGVVIFMLGAALIFFLVSPYVTRLESQRLRMGAQLIVQLVRSGQVPETGPSAERFQAAVERMDTALGMRVVLYSAQNGVLADSREGIASPLPALSLPTARRPEVLQRSRDSQGRRWIYLIRPLDIGLQVGDPLSGGTFLVVGTPYQVRLLALLRNQFFTPFLQAGVGALFLAFLLTLAVSHWVIAPLQRMAKAARTVSAVGLSGGYQPLPLEGPSEVRMLVGSFNEMAERVQSGQQAQRDFVANVSHELKTPLTSIQGFAQALLDGTVDTPEALHQAAEVIYTEAGRMHRLVLDLLDLARMDAGIASFERSPLDLAMLLKNVAEKFEPLARQAQVALQTEVGELPMMTGDGDRLAQVFTNLVDNALKYTPPGGQIILKAQVEGTWVVVSVADTGPGIPPDQLERIFERFYQTDKSRQGGRRGVGLGLAIAREIIQAHGGTISAENNSTQGSVFVVKLPLVRMDDAKRV